MDYLPLGQTGISVSQLCLGAMMFESSTASGSPTIEVTGDSAPSSRRTRC
jgi:aryl-alcohol dehydrogenase-like predicted oxidoreductase